MMTKNIYVPPVKKNSFALLSIEDNEEEITPEPQQSQQPQQPQQPRQPQQLIESVVDFKVYYSKNTGPYTKKYDGQQGSGYPMKEGSGYPMKEGQSGSNYQMKEGSSYSMKEGQSGSSYQMKEGQPGSGYQMKEGQPISGYQMKEGQSGSGYQMKDGRQGGGYHMKEGRQGGGYHMKEGRQGGGYQKYERPPYVPGHQQRNSEEGGGEGDGGGDGEGKWQYQKHNEHKKYDQLKYIYLEVPANLGELKMNNYYRLLAHHNADSNWNFNSYHHVTTLKTWCDVSKLFNTLNLTNYKSNIGNFDFFIMKNEISPLWEDEENRCGSICSVKIDTLKDGYNILKTVFINICNNTLMNISKNNVPNWNIINGVSFSCKKIENVSSAVEQDYSMIKIWFKTNYTQFDNIDKYFNDDINALLKKYSIKVRAIKPEY